MSGTQIRTIDWLSELEKLIGAVSTGIKSFKMGKSRKSNKDIFYQIFHAYVYALSVLAIKELQSGSSQHSINVQIITINSINGMFVFKISPKGYYSKKDYSCFKVIIRKNNINYKIFILMNIDVNVGIHRCDATLNLDIAFLDNFSLYRGNNKECVPMGRVIFFVECKSKSKNNLSPENIATVYGQSCLVKNLTCRNHPYSRIPDVLAVNRSISKNMINIIDYIIKGNRPIALAANIKPFSEGVDKFKNLIKEIIKIAYPI